jgi:hypothetical protein
MSIWSGIKTRAKYILIGMGVLLAIGFFVFIVKLQYDAKARQEALEKSVVEMKQMTDGIARSQSKYVTKEDLEDFAGDMDLDAIEDDLEDLEAEVRGISKILASSSGWGGNNLPSSGTWPRPVDPNDPSGPIQPNVCSGPLLSWCIHEHSSKYLTNAQKLALREKFANGEIPVGDVTFKAWQENPWDVNVLPRDYKVTSVLGEDREGRHYLYHRFTIEADGEEYTVQIDDADFRETYPEAQFEWWNPRVGIGITSGISFPLENFTTDGINAAITPGLYFSPFSYGTSRVKPDWLFAQVAAGYNTVNRTLQFSLSPAMYNLGGNSTLINNTYVGPSVGIDIKKNLSVGGTLSVTF